MLDTARGLNTAVLCAALLAVCVAGWHMNAATQSELLQVPRRPSAAVCERRFSGCVTKRPLRALELFGAGLPPLAWRGGLHVAAAPDESTSVPDVADGGRFCGVLELKGQDSRTTQPSRTRVPLGVPKLERLALARL